MKHKDYDIIKTSQDAPMTITNYRQLSDKYNELRDMADARRESVGNHRYYRMVRACDLFWKRVCNRLIHEETLRLGL